MKIKYNFWLTTKDSLNKKQLIKIQLLMNSQEPQACTKCGCLPEDILMLACSHDLCLNCASQRLAVEMKKNKNANVLVCQECNQKTPLDAESVDVLKSMMKTQSTAPKNQQSNKYNDNIDYRQGRNDGNDRSKYAYNKTSSIGIDRGIDRSAQDKLGNSKTGPPSKLSNAQLFQNIPSKKLCAEHTDQQILYFCFDCKCQCICPQCIIHGKHKQHDVKTVRKAQPIVKNQIDNYIDRYQSNVQGLLIKKSQVEKQIRTLNEQNNLSKRQIQQAFQELRAKINSQQKQLLTRCDQNFQQNLSELQKCSESIHRKMDELKSVSFTMSQATKRDQILFLNFYSRKWRQIQQQSKQPQIHVPNSPLQSNQPVLSQILDVSDQVNRIGTSQRQKAYNR